MAGKSLLHKPCQEEAMGKKPHYLKRRLSKKAVPYCNHRALGILGGSEKEKIAGEKTNKQER